MSKYRKKPVEVEAMLWDGSNTNEVVAWSGARYGNNYEYEYLSIQTLEGAMTAKRGDYIIRGVQGEFYPCKPDIFAETYEPVER